ncbi:MAG TPA: anthranilate synthase component I, partial [Aequorivita sp.]|nr:anthranilate synthase component I [Aequorivita sp.]
EISEKTNVPTILDEFASSFSSEESKFKFINNGLFGFMAFDAVRYFEDIQLSKKEENLEMPDL